MAALATVRPTDKENAPPPSLPSISLSEIDALSTSLRTSRTSVNRTASSSFALSRKKPALGILGIGRAPKSSSSRRHSIKPYGRVTSVQRAKKAANKKVCHKLKKAKGAEQREQEQEREERGEDDAKHALDATTLSLIEERERVTRQIRQDRLRQSVWVPSEAMKGKKVSIPYKLPLPTFPSIPRLKHESLSDKPIDHLYQLLSKHLPNIERLTLAHRPYINVDTLSSSPHDHLASGDSASTSWIPIPEQMALAIPKVVEGQAKEELESLLFKPDVVLVVMNRDEANPTSLDGKILVPAMSMVLATQCAYWQDHFDKSRQLISPYPTPSRDGSTSPVGSTSSSATEVDEVDDDVTLTAETIDLKELDSTSSPSLSEESDFASSFGSVTDSDSDSEASASLPPSMIFARVIPLILPSPATYEIVHQHLHHPERSFLHDLLSIPQSLTTRGEVVAALEDRSVQECMDRLETIQGVWQNLCALGKVGGKTWEHLGGAWAYTVGVITGRGLLNKGARPLDLSKTFAEWVAKEWLLRAKMRDVQAVAQAVKSKRDELQGRQSGEEQTGLERQ